ncbi:phospholipase A2 [Streptomyces qinglanensis]|uniref:Phospholipase A2 n=1 Tax=Streptomyces qinglanensis TaxID=943816 RepID=A0A1H9T0J7_9ACTN|nr:phospholipase A2 [Streptomyces qinglanensis]SER90668.1 phospholipase A2 [Streptomyces qinglanensis]
MRARMLSAVPTGVLTVSVLLGALVAPGTAAAAAPARSATGSSAVRSPSGAPAAVLPAPLHAVRPTGPATRTPPADPAVRAEADRLMELTYRQFAVARHTPPFDWTTDGCSVPTGLLPYSEVFRPACVQHDFGYRNYGGNHALKLDPTRATKNWIDSRFRTEMRRICDDRYSTAGRRRNCRRAADTYYAGVRIGGDKAFF